MMMSFFITHAVTTAMWNQKLAVKNAAKAKEAAASKWWKVFKCKHCSDTKKIQPVTDGKVFDCPYC